MNYIMKYILRKNQNQKILILPYNRIIKFMN